MRGPPQFASSKLYISYVGIAHAEQYFSDSFESLLDKVCKSLLLLPTNHASLGNHLIAAEFKQAYSAMLPARNRDLEIAVLSGN
jgi:hypothetical protein